MGAHLVRVMCRTGQSWDRRSASVPAVVMTFTHTDVDDSPLPSARRRECCDREDDSSISDCTRRTSAPFPNKIPNRPVGGGAGSGASTREVTMHCETTARPNMPVSTLGSVRLHAGLEAISTSST